MFFPLISTEATDSRRKSEIQKCSILHDQMSSADE
jgi:hypothetical protein